MLPLVFLLLTGLWSRVAATSAQAYKDYLFQYDLYRQYNADFKVARTEYFKFQSLLSQNAALEKAKTVLGQRDELLRAYLLLLNEKLNEDPGLSTVEKQLYQRLITSEITFLQNHILLIPSIGSLEDAETVSGQLTTHYAILYASMRQTMVALSLGQLAMSAKQYEQILTGATNLLRTNRSGFAAQKQAVLDRWLLSVTDKKSLYQQKIDTITKANSLIKGSSPEEVDSLYAKVRKDLAEAKQYLGEGVSYMQELVNAARYQD